MFRVILVEFVHKIDSSMTDPEGNQSCAVHWEPPPEEMYRWRHDRPKVPKSSLRIYECHVGVSGSQPKVTSFNEFTSKVDNNFINTFSGQLYLDFRDIHPV
jgi:1,4-alpha-glucan branching enzyme